MFSQSKGLTFNRQAALNTISQSIESGELVADLFANNKVEPPVYHYIITRRGSSEILDWGQGFSMESLRHEAEAWMFRHGLKVAV